MLGSYIAAPRRYRVAAMAAVILACFISNAASPAAPRHEPQCRAAAYLASADGSPVNLRSSPSIREKPIKRIRAQTMAVATIFGQSGEWMRVVRIADAERDDLPIFAGDAWIHRSQLGLDVAGGRHRLWPGPAKRGRPVMRLEGDRSSLEIMGCQGRWLKVRADRTVTGWIAPEAQCSSPLTTCS